MAVIWYFKSGAAEQFDCRTSSTLLLMHETTYLHTITTRNSENYSSSSESALGGGVPGSSSAGAASGGPCSHSGATAAWGRPVLHVHQPHGTATGTKAPTVSTQGVPVMELRARPPAPDRPRRPAPDRPRRPRPPCPAPDRPRRPRPPCPAPDRPPQIGRASCRERVCLYV